MSLRYCKLKLWVKVRHCEAGHRNEANHTVTLVTSAETSSVIALWVDKLGVGESSPVPLGLTGGLRGGAAGKLFLFFFARSADSFLARSEVVGAPNRDFMGAYASATNLSIVASTVLTGGGGLEGLVVLGFALTPNPRAHLLARCPKVLDVIQLHCLSSSVMLVSITRS